jgi:hypothetical protein
LGKTQHYVPQLLLRRFVVRDGRRQGHIWRLDKTTGTARAAVPRHEAAKNRYYDLPEDVVGDFGQPEELIRQIESAASIAIRKLEREQPPSDEEMGMLAYFAALQWARTPAVRSELKFLDEVMAREMAQLKLSARERVLEALRATTHPSAMKTRRLAA